MRGRVQREGVGACLADACDRRRPVAVPVAVRVGVQGVGARVRGVDVGPGIGLDRVLEPVAVVVGVLD